MNDMQKHFHKIPSVNWLIEELQNDFPGMKAEYLQRIILPCIEQVQQNPHKFNIEKHDKDAFRTRILQSLKNDLNQLQRGSIKKVINATGVILHTGLGRAPVNSDIIENLQTVNRYTSLEINLKSGKRGQRNDHLSELIRILTGAEAGIAVNNNAAAVMLMLNTFGNRKEVILSRGQMIEIGGSFRMPEVMRMSGCRLREIGTTNKTHLRDYEDAINKRTGAILLCHTSNYEVKGFTAHPDLEEIAALAQRHNIPLIFDLGSGSLISEKIFGGQTEPDVSSFIEAGIDLVSFSGDKLLGGPQAGIIAGRKKWVQKCAKNHMLRALRLDKFMLKTLQQILIRYITDPESIETVIALKTGREELIERCNDFASKLSELDAEIETVPSAGKTGSGAYPLMELQSAAVRIKPRSKSVNWLASKLRQNHIPIFGYVEDDSLYLDLRVVTAEEENEISRVFKTLL